MKVLWIGTDCNTFHPKKGIRKVDPVTPYIFVMYMDKLSHLIQEAFNKGEWKSLKDGRSEPTISHHIFVDDLLLVGKATTKQMECVNEILMKFCDMSANKSTKTRQRYFSLKTLQNTLEDN